jgi:hypothetical protein
MVEFYLLAAGVYLYYSKSKYSPDFLFRATPGLAFWFGNALLLTGTLAYVFHYGWASGLLVALCAASLAATLLPFFAVLGKKYFYGLAILVHSLLLVDLISYAR